MATRKNKELPFSGGWIAPDGEFYPVKYGTHGPVTSMVGLLNIIHRNGTCKAIVISLTPYV